MPPCTECGWSPARSDARFCNACGAALSDAHAYTFRGTRQFPSPPEPQPNLRYGVVEDPEVAYAVVQPNQISAETVISAEQMARVEYLNVWSGQRSYDLEGLQHATNLKAAGITFGWNRPGEPPLATVKNLGLLTELPNLWSVRLQYLDITDLQVLPALTQVTHLEVRDLPVSDLTPLSRLTNLRSLHLARLRSLANLGSLAGLTSLTGLHIEEMPHIASLGPLASLTNLKELKLKGWTRYNDSAQPGFPNVRDLRPLAHLTQLEVLSLDGFPKVRDLSPLAGLTKLDHLWLEEFPQVKSLAPLGHLKNLETLELLRMPRAKDVRPLATLTKAERLVLHQYFGRMDVRSLSGLKAQILHSPVHMSDLRAGRTRW